MNESLMLALERAAAAVSLLLMGACGVGLLARLVRVLRGQEPAGDLANEEGQAPLREIALAMGAALLSRIRISGGSMVLSAKASLSGGMRVALSKCAHSPRACTPASVRLEPVTVTGSPVSFASVSSSTCWTLGPLICRCQPQYAVPSYSHTSRKRCCPSGG